MKQCIAILIFLVAIQSCNAQNNKIKQAKESVDSVKIIDPIVKMPYEIKGNNKVITLPKNIGGKNIKGYVFLELVVNDRSKIIKTTIMKLSLSNKDKCLVINYNISQGKLPTNLKEYATFFDNYCKNKIIISKRYATTQSKYPMIFRLKIE